MRNSKLNLWEELGNLPRVLQVNSGKFSSNTALDSVDGTSYNYLELERSARFVASMLHSAGIEKGDRVVILSENSPHWPIAWFGALAAGATS